MGTNTGLLNLIDKRIKKILSKFKILKYKPAVVQSVNTDTVSVKFEDNTVMTLPNLSGNFVLPNTVVLVYYWGNVINKNTAYIGKNATSVTVCNASEYNAKENVLYFIQDTGEIYVGNTKYGGGQNNYFNTLSTEILKGSLFIEGKTVASYDFKCTDVSTTCIVSADVEISTNTSELITVEYYIDDILQAFAPQITLNSGRILQHLQYVFNNVSIGEHNVTIKIKGDYGYIESGIGHISGYNIQSIPAKPTTADDYVYIIENDTVKLIFYRGTETRIQIPSEIEGKPVTEIESTCFTNSNVKYAVIPETVEKIY